MGAHKAGTLSSVWGVGGGVSEAVVLLELLVCAPGTQQVRGPSGWSVGQTSSHLRYVLWASPAPRETSRPVKQRPVRCVQPPSFSEACSQHLESPGLKAHFLEWRDRCSCGLGPPGPPASGCTDHSPGRSSGHGSNPSGSDSTSRPLLREGGRGKASFPAVHGTTEAARLQVSFPGSGRARTGIQGAGTEAACGLCEPQQRTT